jgi:hypothetical protein
MKKKKMYVLDIVALVAAVILIGLTGLVSSCAVSRGQGDDTKEVTLYGLGTGKSIDENTAREIAIDVALGSLSKKYESKVKSASSNYTRQSGNKNTTLYESLIDIYTNNILRGVEYKGDRRPVRRNMRGEYIYRVEARVNQTVLKRSVDTVLDNYEMTREQRQAFREEMMGAGNY